jgi:hypothetical protein
VRTSLLQQRNRRILRESLFLRYEDLCDQPEKTAALLCEFIPELESLDSSRIFEVMDQTGRIRNLKWRADRAAGRGGPGGDQLGPLAASRPDGIAWLFRPGGGRLVTYGADGRICRAAA